jgi:CheY-like chemotaxis protein
MTNPDNRPVALVVEDEPIILMDAADILGELGFEVLEAWNGDTALALLAGRDPVDLLFTDVHMPGTLDGFALARTVAGRWPGTKVVVCSGHVTPTPGDLPAGAIFIDKPFSSDLVSETLARFR